MIIFLDGIYRKHKIHENLWEENGRDYMFFTSELDEFQIVQYDCYVQLNEEYLY